MAATAGTATETERELDRVWKAIDDAAGRLDALERGRGLQLAPCPDYRTSEPEAEPEPVEACSCEEALALKVRVAELEAGNADLRRRIVNQAAAHAAPRLKDVARIHELEAERKALRELLEQEQTARAAWAEKASEAVSLRGRVERALSVLSDDHHLTPREREAQEALRGE